MSSSNTASPAKLPVHGDNKGSSSTSGSGSGRKTGHLKPPEQGLKCPRCDSSNTKFCYYNNYSLAQPRHFCKTCRRYWTKGGALRNVPIGGGTRRSKKMKSNSSRISGLDSKNSTLSSSETSSFEIYHRISPAAMEFQLGGLIPHFPGLHSSSITGSFDQLASATAANPSCLESSVRPSSLMGSFNYPLSSTIINGDFNGRIHQEMGGSLISFNSSSGFASPIESLSCINQDRHLKLQQQRLGSSVMFGAEGNDQENSTTVCTCLPGGAILEEDHQISTSSKPQPNISFQNLEILKPAVPNCGVISHPIRTTDWLFEINSFAPTSTSTSTTTVSTNYNSKVDGNTSNWSNGLQSWNALNQFSSLP